jgi:signal transduction histidine kinase/DNA-binding response OmpR family regulator
VDGLSTGPLAGASAGDRYAEGERVRWRNLIDSTATLPAAMTLEHVQQFFRENENETFAAVLDGGRIVGLASELSLSRKLTASRGLGYCVYAKTVLARHVEPQCLVIGEEEPVRPVLERVMTRTQGFFDDIIVTAADGSFLGLIRTRTMMLLQHRITNQQVDELEAITRQLNENNTELERARDAATQAAEMKSTFLANMSHEIRTPLNGILGMVKILLRTPLAEAQRRYASTVLQSANALLAILNDILDFSKIEAGKMTFEAVPFDLNDLTEEVVQLLAERAREKHLEIFSWRDAQAPTQLIGDPTRLRQVILNLTSNAVKFTEKGQVILRIEPLRETATHARLKVSVQDTGIGIADEVKVRLFSAFEQGDRSTSRKFGGTGLGLAISKKIIEMCGGRIGCDSRLGEGSTFWFEIELPKQAGAAATGQREDELWGLRILVAHDNPAFAGYIENNLSRWKVVTRVTRSAAEAVSAIHAQALRGTPFDFVISDVQFGTTRGVDFSRQVHADPLHQRTKVVLLTSIDGEITPQACAESAVTATLAKPVKPSELYRVLSKSLAGSNGTETPESPRAPEAVEAVQAARPTKTPEVGALEPTAVPPIASSPQERACPPLRLLLVEDSEVNREVALLLLGSWGHTLGTAENGRAALECLAQQDYDGVLMDCQMPEMDGYEATRAIRDPGSPVRDHGIHIIAMTANAMPGDRERCLQAGMNDYVGKPIDEAELLAALLRCAGRKASSSGPLASPQSVPEAVPAPAQPDQEMPTTTGATPSEIRNPKLEAAAADDEPYFPARLIQLFLRETSNRLADLAEAFGREDAEAVQRIAHTIKGTAGNFRAQRLYELAREVELASRQGRMHELNGQIGQMREAFAAVEHKFSAPHEHAS